MNGLPTTHVFNGEMRDEKYRKRRKQKRGERLRQSLYLLAVALIMLLYTWRSLLSIPEESDETPAYRHRRMKGYEPKEHKKKKKERGNGKGETSVEKEVGGSSEQSKRANSLFGTWFHDDIIGKLDEDLAEIENSIIGNKNIGLRWVRPELLPPLTTYDEKPLLSFGARKRKESKSPGRFFKAKRLAKRLAMKWEGEDFDSEIGPTVDFTRHSYEYPEKLTELPTLGEYPVLSPLREILKIWPQDDIDHAPAPFKETLMHFDFLNKSDLKTALKFREAKLPFKLTNVPEVMEAGKKWTDEYLSQNFDGGNNQYGHPRAMGTCQESLDNYFAFFSQATWAVDSMGIPPTRNNDWTFAKWAEHARYADATQLHPHKPHFYFQAGVDKEERYQDQSSWTFISRDLPSFSSVQENFFLFEPESQKGIQCRFGERGVTAATHFDSGRNMVAMMTGAKRYILSPPNQCSKLGIVTARDNAIFRHSMLNFGHLNEIPNNDMPVDEEAWLERAGESLAVDTILKAGEVLYIPSHWFHYITSLQKSAQCNVRSGVDVEGDEYFGGKSDVVHHCDPLLENGDNNY